MAPKLEQRSMTNNFSNQIPAWTVSGGVTSHPVLRQVRLYPEPASAITARDISDTELTLSWKAPQGDWNSFEVSLFQLLRALFPYLYDCISISSWSIWTTIICLSKNSPNKLSSQ